jgi:hypothetical protein
MNVVCALLCCSNEKAKKERQKRATLTLCSWRAGEREEKEKEKERELCSRGRRTGGGRMYEPGETGSPQKVADSQHQPNFPAAAAALDVITARTTHTAKGSPVECSSRCCP